MASAEGDDRTAIVSGGGEEVVGEVLQPTDLNIQGRLAAVNWKANQPLLNSVRHHTKHDHDRGKKESDQL